ncbi:MAG: H-NS histone family protein [Sterolibacterium sp.]|nr:H-NS histone family protein [Sterolibacterium sp.]
MNNDQEINLIEQQIKELAAKKQALLNKHRHEVIQKARTMIAEYSLTASELGLSGRGKTAGSGRKAAPKYANPQNSAQTWSGRGPHPKWVKETLAKGGSLESLLIAKG